MQIIARIHTANQPVRVIIHDVLVRIGRHHPQALMYPLLVACKSQSASRRSAAMSVVDNVRQHAATLVEQAQLVSQVTSFGVFSYLGCTQWRMVSESLRAAWMCCAVLAVGGLVDEAQLVCQVCLWGGLFTYSGWAGWLLVSAALHAAEMCCAVLHCAQRCQAGTAGAACEPGELNAGA